MDTCSLSFAINHEAAAADILAYREEVAQAIVSSDMDDFFNLLLLG
jgi:hypothetical protein